jgi:phosphoserine phosphatase
VKAISKQQKRLIVFDVEGVLIPKNRFFFEIGKSMGFIKLIKFLFFGFLYETGIIQLELALKHIFSNLKGIKTESLMNISEKIPVTPSINNLFEQIKLRNYKIAIISSGVPTLFVRKLADAVGAEYAYGIEVGESNGNLTGKIWGDAIENNGKFRILKQILNDEGLTFSNCVVVADDRNNRCIFLPEILKIGYNPDFVLRVMADKVVINKLSRILPIIDGKRIKRSFPSKNDFFRENIHATGFFIPVIAGLIGIPVVAAFILTVSLLYLVSELFRLEGKDLPLISMITRHAASQSELYGFAAAPLYFAFGILLTLVLFPTLAGATAIAMFALGDSAASIFGGLFSKTLPFNKGKTLEGSLAGFLFAFLGGLFFVSPVLALVGAAIAMTIEVLPLPINDNILIPVITGLALTLLI